MNGNKNVQDDPLTFYHRRVLEMNKERLSKDHLYERIKRAKQFIDDFYFKNIDVGTVANNAFVSKFHFIRLFKENYGRTPHQHLTDVRIKAARKLLQSGMPVSEVCASVGFGSVTSFTALFKKFTGSVPSVFQQKNKQV